MRKHCYSSIDRDGISDPISDPEWEQEGLFAHVGGRRRPADLNLASVEVRVTKVRSAGGRRLACGNSVVDS
jgi:hypothetical protein